MELVVAEPFCEVPHMRGMIAEAVLAPMLPTGDRCFLPCGQPLWVRHYRGRPRGGGPPEAVFSVR
jgi:hypothetical protein